MCGYNLPTHRMIREELPQSTIFLHSCTIGKSPLIAHQYPIRVAVPRARALDTHALYGVEVLHL
eukprot:31432-Eustigmatos_ZCMA.PRE.1